MEDIRVISDKPSAIWIKCLSLEEKISGQYYSSKYLNLEKQLKNNLLIKLGDITKEYNGGPMGFQLHSYDYVKQGMPIVRTKDMKEMTIIFKEPIFITKEKHDELKVSKTYPGDIVISKTGQIGVVSVVPETIQEVNLNQALCNIRLKNNSVYNYFLVVYLNCKYGQYQFIREGEGKAVQNGLTKTEILEILIPIPSPEIQKYIGDKVRKAEELREEVKFEKNELNNKFLNLIGIGVKAEYEDEKFRWATNSELTAISIIPEFYKTKYLKNEELISGSKFKFEKIKDICEFIDEGSTPASKHPKEYYSEGELFIRGGNIDRNFIDLTTVARITKKDYERLPKGPFLGGDVLLTMRGNFGYSAVVHENIKEFKVNPTIAVLRPKDYVNKYYLAVYLNSTICRVQMDRLGQTSTRPQLNLSEVKTIKVIIPPMNIQEEIESKVKDYINKEQVSKKLIQEAKQDVEDLIEGNFDMAKLN